MRLTALLLPGLRTLYSVAVEKVTAIGFIWRGSVDFGLPASQSHTRAVDGAAMMLVKGLALYDSLVDVLQASEVALAMGSTEQK